ncbi:MAG: ATP-binding cassette domain-containing protein [Patescibacteria group bacterium]|nr:ATP-binding cassette domain-containing protein [Patescibacteria group bacterium]
MIKFQNVSKIFYSQGKPIVALENVSFEIKKGEFVSIVGRSGAGKTTLVRLLINEIEPTAGELFFKGMSLQKMNQKELQTLRKKIGVVHQDYKLLLSKNVKENIEYVMQVIGAPDKDISRDVPQILELVGLRERAENFPQELSGGEKQRLAIARALCHRPEVIVADEPTGNLDLYNTFEIINLLKKIHSFGTTLVLATHNKEVIDRLKKRVVTLEEGRMVHDLQKGKFLL